MSLMQEMQMMKHIIGEENSNLVEKYCEKTGADLGKVLYTIKGWREFEAWKQNRPAMIIDDIQEIESKYHPRVRVRFKKENDPRGWRSLETLKSAVLRKIDELGEECLTENARKQYESMKD